MNKITKINLGIFILLSIITIVINLINYKRDLNLPIIFMILSFNLIVGLLSILAIYELVKMSKRGFRVFIFYIILVSFSYWYILSSITHWYYGTFISIGGLYYFIATRTYLAAIIFYVSSAFIIISLSLILFYYTRPYIIKDFPRKKLNKKIIFLLILMPIFILMLILVIIPKSQAYQTSPILDIISQYVLADIPKGDPIDFGNNQEEVRILNKIDINNPNVIIVMLESVSAEHLHYYGYKRNITPNIDALAEKSIVFNRAYSSSSHSDYAQTSFLSSRYSLINSYRNFFNINYPRVFIWDILKEQGDYSTAYISSQDDNWANMIRYYKKDNLDFYSYSLTDNKYDYGSGIAKKDYDENTMNEVINWINQTSTPFFLYVNMQGTHYPYEYPENNSLFVPDKPSTSTSYFDIASGDYNSSLNAYDNSIFYVDKQIGKLISILENQNLLENSIIILSADHGEILKARHNNIRHGFGVYEEEVKIPLIIYLPNSEHKIVEDRVRSIDVVPSVLDILDFNLSEEFQGRPMVKNSEIFLTTQNQNFKIGLIKNDIKYILNGISYIPEAYNLTEDPLEQNNLIKNEKDERFYYFRYGYILYSWYKCQIKYYEKERWEEGEVIDC